LFRGERYKKMGPQLQDFDSAWVQAVVAE